MAGGIDWFRWHHGSVTDPKFQLVARKAGARLSDVLAIWAYVLEHASAADVRGEFGDLDAEAIDCLFGFDDGLTASVLVQMGVRGLVCDGVVSSWVKRQPKREREGDSSTERSRAFRQKQRHATPESDDATPCNATQRQETPRGEESREEKNTTSLRSVVVAAQGAPATPAAKASRGTRLPQDWFLPKAWGEWALKEFHHWTADIVRLESEKFRDHWHAKSGKDATKNDWDAAWRNWCRSDIAQRTHAPPSASSETAYQRSMRERVEQAAGSMAHVVAAKAPGQRKPQPWDIQHDQHTIEADSAPALVIGMG